MLLLKIRFACFALAVVMASVAYKPLLSPPQVTGFDKTACTVLPGPTVQKLVYLNLSAANLTDYGGQTFYYCFFNSANALVETATAVVSASNPQKIAVSTLANGVAYSVSAFDSAPTAPSGPGQQNFNTAFNCKKKVQNPAANYPAQSTGGGHAKKKKQKN